MIPQQDAARLTGWQRFRQFPVTRIALFLFGLHAKHHLQVAEMVSESYVALCTVGAYALMVRVVEKRSLASAGFTVNGLGPAPACQLIRFIR